MLNNLFFLLVTAVFIYSAIFIVYFIVVVAASIIKPKRKKYSEIVNKEYKNLIVVIYSHNDENTIGTLLEQLKRQEYPNYNYQIHIILDNCTDNSSNKLEIIGGAKLWRLSDDKPLGRDKAVSWLLENLMSFKQVDAYVFLNANRMIKSNFLMSINESLQENSVIVGSTEIFLENADFTEKVWAKVNEYNVNVMKLGRSRLGLAVPVDSDITVIKHEVLEKVRCIDFNNANSELKYSFLLTSINHVPKFEPKIKTYVSSLFYKTRRPDFLFKMSLFFHCFNFKTMSNFKFAEFLFSLFKPNPLILIAFLITACVYAFNYYFIVDYSLAIWLGIILTFAFGFSMFTSDLYSKSCGYLAVAPFITLFQTLSKVKFINKFFKFEIKPNKQKVENVIVPINVTNGRSVFPCKLELISEEGFNKAIFHYKNKKQETTQGFVRMCDAVKNISDILEQHGFRMKICQTCAYFSPKIDGTNNMVKGYCNKLAIDNPNNVDLPETLLWLSCENYIPEEVNKVIDIANFIKNK